MSNEEKAKEIIGCCSGCTFSCGDRLNCKAENKYNIAMEMAAWKEQQLIEKAVKWLLDGGYFINSTESIEDFKKAMMEE